MLATGLAMAASPLAAREALGIFSTWGAFADGKAGLCYAIAQAETGKGAPTYQAYADVANWPRSAIRGQVHFRLSQPLARGSVVSLRVGRTSFPITGGGADAWPRDRKMDAAVVAAMRSAESMSVTAIAKDGKRFTDRYVLAGAASAMDAATVACARMR